MDFYLNGSPDSLKHPPMTNNRIRLSGTVSWTFLQHLQIIQKVIFINLSFKTNKKVKLKEKNMKRTRFRTPRLVVLKFFNNYKNSETISRFNSGIFEADFEFWNGNRRILERKKCSKMIPISSMNSRILVPKIRLQAFAGAFG